MEVYYGRDWELISENDLDRTIRDFNLLEEKKEIASFWNLQTIWRFLEWAFFVDKWKISKKLKKKPLKQTFKKLTFVVFINKGSIKIADSFQNLGKLYKEK